MIDIFISAFIGSIIGCTMGVIFMCIVRIGDD